MLEERRARRKGNLRKSKRKARKSRKETD